MCYNSILIVSLLFVIPLPNRAIAQTEDHRMNIRVGRGSSMTDAPVLASVFLSLPDQLLFDGYPTIYLDKNLLVSEENKKIDFIMGASPMLQFELFRGLPRLAVEAGVGVNYVSRRQMGGRRLGSNVLFCTTLSGGIELPWTNGLLGIFYTFKHLSNAGLSEHNAGINFQYLVVSFNFSSL